MVVPGRGSSATLAGGLSSGRLMSRVLQVPVPTFVATQSVVVTFPEVVPVRCGHAE